MDFVVTKLLFTLKLTADVPDPFALYALRQDFMDSFRAAVCRHGGNCVTCPDQNGCSYHHTFSQALADDPAALKRHQKPPLPFVFDLPVLADFPNNGLECEIGLTLAGSAINYVADYISALRLLFGTDDPARKVRGTVVRVESLACSDYRILIMENGGKPLLDRLATISARDLLEMNTLDPNRIEVEIISPLRIIQDGQPLREFSFSLFIRSLLRRTSSLAYYYYGNGLEVDYKWLSSLSMTIEAEWGEFTWNDWRKHHASERLGGIVGSGSFRGRLEDFHLFLLLGEYLHVGKGAPFGLGRFRIARKN